MDLKRGRAGAIYFDARDPRRRDADAQVSRPGNRQAPSGRRRAGRGDGGVEFSAELAGNGGILAGTGSVPYVGSGSVTFSAALAGTGRIPIVGTGDVTIAAALAGTNTRARAASASVRAGRLGEAGRHGPAIQALGRVQQHPPRADAGLEISRTVVRDSPVLKSSSAHVAFGQFLVPFCAQYDFEIPQIHGDS